MTIKIRDVSKKALVWAKDPLTGKRRRLYEHNGDFYRVVREYWAVDTVGGKRFRETELEVAIQKKPVQKEAAREKETEERESAQKRTIVVRRTRVKGIDVTPKIEGF